MTERLGYYFRYSGQSMWPCFQEGDLLEVEPVTRSLLRRGDCLLFADQDGGQIVHRVTGTGEKLATRGDAMPEDDRHALTDANIIGRVVWRYRLGKKSHVAGGLTGLAAGRFYGLAGRVDPQRASRGGRLGRMILALSTGALKPLWLHGREQRLNLPGQEPLVVWCLGKQVIGRQNPNNGGWTINWPWKLLVRLPTDARD